MGAGSEDVEAVTAQEQKGNGRPGRGPRVFPEITDRRKRAFLVSYVELGTVSGAAAAAGIDRRLVYTERWQNDEVFQAAYARAQVAAADALEAEARRRAVEGVRSYKFGKDGKPLRHPEQCDCQHQATVHQPSEEGPRAGACTAQGCTCKRFNGQPYYEHAYSDVLLIFTLKALLPDKYRESVELRDGRFKVDWHKLAAQPGGQALIKRIADGEDFRVVLDGILDQLRQAGVIEYGAPKRLGPGG